MLLKHVKPNADDDIDAHMYLDIACDMPVPICSYRLWSDVPPGQSAQNVKTEVVAHIVDMHVALLGAPSDIDML